MVGQLFYWLGYVDGYCCMDYFSVTVRGLAAVGSPQPIAQGIEHLFLYITKKNVYSFFFNSSGRVHLLNFITWYRYSAIENQSACAHTHTHTHTQRYSLYCC